MEPRRIGRPPVVAGHKRVGSSIPPKQKAALERMSKETGVPETELVRRAVEAYLKEKGYVE